MAPATRARTTPQKLASENVVTPRKPIGGRSRIAQMIASPMRISSPLNLVKKVLTGSAPDTLVGRIQEYTKISSLVKSALLGQKSIAIYVSGGPGTGKTLTVNHVVENLKLNYDFKTLVINCMHIDSIKDFYTHVSAQFGSSPKKAKRQADEANDYILKTEELLRNQKQMTVLILDEIDQLKSNSNEALRRIFTIPNDVPDKVILIGISNLLDFCSKMSWLSEFTKSTLHDLKFKPYTKDQIVDIIQQRLNNAGNGENDIVDKFAVDYCARKISACSGDIRKALDVCRRAVEIVEASNRQLHSSIPLKPSTPSKCSASPTKAVLTPARRRLFDDNRIADEAPKSCSYDRVDVRTMMNVLNKVYGGVVDKLDDGKKVFLPADQQLILAVMLILYRVKKLRDVKISELRLYTSKICTKRNISSEGKTESDLLGLSRLLQQHGYMTVSNDDNNGPMSGRSPAKRTPNKKKQLHVSLRLEPSEIEQLLGTFYINIINDADKLIS